MGVVDWIIAGLIVGLFARLLVPGRSPIGCLGTILLGVLGIYLGGTLWEEIFGPDGGVPWIGSIVVAAIMLASFRALARRSF